MHALAPGNPIRTSSLSRSDRLLLWAMRTWVIALKQRVDAAPPLEAAFTRYSLPAGAQLVDALMSVVACGATRPLTIECVCCGIASSDESRLLAAAGLYQRDQGFEATFLLRDMLAPAPSRAAGEILQRLSEVLLEGAQWLSAWELRTERFSFPARGATCLRLH